MKTKTIKYLLTAVTVTSGTIAIIIPLSLMIRHGLSAGFDIPTGIWEMAFATICILSDYALSIVKKQ